MRAALLLVLVLAGCTSPPPFSWKFGDKLPEEFSFEIGGVTHDEYQLAQDGLMTKTRITFESNAGNIPPNVTVICTFLPVRSTKVRSVAEADMREFLEKIGPLNIPAWKGHYTTRTTYIDGYVWKLHWKKHGRVVDAEGSCAGPDIDNPRRTVDDFEEKKMTGDLVLQRALEELWKRAR